MARTTKPERDAIALCQAAKDEQNGRRLWWTAIRNLTLRTGMTWSQAEAAARHAAERQWLRLDGDPAGVVMLTEEGHQMLAARKKR